MSLLFLFRNRRLPSLGRSRVEHTQAGVEPRSRDHDHTVTGKTAL